MIVVPEPDHRVGQIALVADRTQARRSQQEILPPIARIQGKPASGKDTEKMAARKDQYVPRDCAEAFDHAICPRADLWRRFASRTAILEQFPVRTILMNLRRP